MASKNLRELVNAYGAASLNGEENLEEKLLDALKQSEVLVGNLKRKDLILRLENALLYFNQNLNLEIEDLKKSAKKRNIFIITNFLTKVFTSFFFISYVFLANARFFDREIVVELIMEDERLAYFCISLFAGLIWHVSSLFHYKIFSGRRILPGFYKQKEIIRSIFFVSCISISSYFLPEWKDFTLQYFDGGQLNKLFTISYFFLGIEHLGPVLIPTLIFFVFGTIKTAQRVTRF